jgi:hypothetical protein
MPRAAAESILRVVVVFFAALFGFGLKRLLDEGIPDAHWPAFLVAAILFLRFLLGVSTHMWSKHVRRMREDETAHMGHFALDLGFLVTYGLAGPFICYATTAREFLGRALLFTLLPIAWSFVEDATDWARRFRRFNFMQLTGLVVCLVLLNGDALWPREHFLKLNPVCIPIVSAHLDEAWFVPARIGWTWVLALGVSVCVMWLDVGFQLSKLRISGSRPPLTSDTAIWAGAGALAGGIVAGAIWSLGSSACTDAHWLPLVLIGALTGTALGYALSRVKAWS